MMDVGGSVSELLDPGSLGIGAISIGVVGDTEKEGPFAVIPR